VKVLRILCEEAPTSHTQAVVDTQRAAAMGNKSTWRRMWETLVITASEANTRNPPQRMLFSLNKEDITNECIVLSLLSNALANPHHRYCLVHHSNMYFPFLTSQYKTVMSGDNQIDARLSATSHGALVVNYMHRFYSHACPDRGLSQLIIPVLLDGAYCVDTSTQFKGRGGNAEDLTQLHRLRDRRTTEVH
jgi:hypothetical protein